MTMDALIWATAAEGGLRLLAARTTDLVAEAQRRHGTYPVPTAALGRSLTAVALLAAMQKGEERVTLRVLGDGPLGGVIAQGDGTGKVRGYVQHPDLELPPTAAGKLDVGTAVGKEGFLHVTRDLGLREAYTGSSALISGEIAEDLTYYLNISEQTPSACALGVLIDRDGSVLSAGGFILQRMPGADESLIDQLEERIKALGPISRFFQSDRDVQELVTALLGDLNVQILARKKPIFQCNCDRERLRTLLKSMGPEELASMHAEQGQAEICCHFCNAQYLFTGEELLALAEEVKTTPSAE
ncbi:Hsp33 family molecular chaperone HslO [Heliophilum fasciatum]|uniref:33 kDa chaperonin n=1 Tax=Heliophilum fasciatum TaxID=35700 RepID=A0A4R2RYL5_9FIRM|nr:Hsp33 family molecular chaperone HslO [Heliophilum fasciatum]MCW2277196.1 molecular chaperone Hsp33 [Heliophilum fasciatum]TCP68169.1 molecular chaperone Hsp33 [Heliophilum fasciatum]